jgi:peroxiredoxin
MNRACLANNSNLHEQNQHASSIRPIKSNFVRMKKIFSLLVAAGLLAGSSAQTPHYVINGNINGSDDVTFILQQNVKGRMVNIDTVIVVNGMFRITGGSVEYPEMVNLVTLDRKKSISFYLENTDITISGNLESLSSSKITGSKTQDELLPLTEFIKPLGEKYNAKNAELQAATKAGNSEKVNEIRKEMDRMMKDVLAFELDFIKNNPGSFAVPPILRSLAPNMQTSELESIINAMDPAVAKTAVITELKARIGLLKNVDIGKKAPDFTMNNPQGIPVSLSSKIGAKVLLIDFWAAWCSPCRAENPNVVKVYKEFNSKGFDIFGVSLDRSGTDWNKAIGDDNLTWTHVSDLQYWNNAAARLYGVNSIPANFLLDVNGIIIAKNLRGEALYNKVKELLDSK